MTSTDSASAFALWQAKFNAMKASLAELGVVPTNVGSLDLGLGDSAGWPSEPRRGQDVWDFISDDESDECDEIDDEPFRDAADAVQGHGIEWLSGRCFGVAVRTGMAVDVLQSQIVDILLSKRSEDELQSQLIDLVGFDDIEFVIELLAHRAEISTALLEKSAGHQPQPGGPPPRLLSKAERDKALRQRDYAHKNAALGAASKKPAEYPHVYKSYHAGNTISHAGKRYGLPVGAERREFDKYEEFYVPPGTTGSLAPGQKLVSIEDMDGLCRGTFKGYKTLNRMQSLVYPVAYRTIENMLICAPTGAVRLVSVTVAVDVGCR